MGGWHAPRIAEDVVLAVACARLPAPARNRGAQVVRDAV
jgi:hypothetical protein